MAHDTGMPPGMPNNPPPLPPPPPPMHDYAFAPRAASTRVQAKADLSSTAFGLWMFILGALLLARAVHMYAATKGVPFAVGSASAPFLMGALIAGICRLCGARRFRLTMAIAVSVVTVLSVIGSIGQSTTQRDVHNAALQMRDIVDGKPIQASQGYGPLSEIMPKVQELVQDEQRREAQHKAAQDALQLETVLAPATLVDRALIADARDRLARGLAETRASVRDYAEFVHSLRELLATLPDDQRTAALAGFDSKLSPLELAMNRFVGVEENFHIIANGLLNFSEANLGKIHLDKATGDLSMSRELAADYNTRIRAVRAVAKEEDAATADLKQLQALGRADMDDLEKQYRQ